MAKKIKILSFIDWDLQLPDFADPGVFLRVGIVANFFMLIGALLRQDHVWAPFESFIAIAAIGEPALLLSMLILALFWKRSNLKVRSLLALFSGSISVALLSLLKPGYSWSDTLLSCVNAMIVSFLLCLYFDWRYRRLSPAVAEAKLEALVARMQPHFLFNAINGIVMLLNTSPKDAEEALLDLSDVFRALLKEGNGMAKVCDEVALTEKYLRIEKMRFGERLQVKLTLDAKCKNVLIPTMLLQPLVENAVIHGVEVVGSGVIYINVFVKDGSLFLIVENAYTLKPVNKVIRRTNGMAMDNIRQRLSLIYDVEAKLLAGPHGDGIWRVAIKIPAHAEVVSGGFNSARGGRVI